MSITPEQLAILMQEVERADPIDFADLPFNEEELRGLIANHLCEMADAMESFTAEDRNLALLAVAAKLVRQCNLANSIMLRLTRVIDRAALTAIMTGAIDADFVQGPDYSGLANAAATFQGLIGEGAFVRRGEGERMKETAVVDFHHAMQWLRDEAERTVSKQRYKGLGEMNPAQLWETTMDPTVRRLLKVQIEDAIAADQIFTTLMGDDVEPHRAFIESNALRCGPGISTFNSLSA